MKRILFGAGVLAGYWFLSLTLATQASLFEPSPGTPPWFPTAGLDLALLVLFGPAFTPAVFAAFVGSAWAIHALPGAPHHLLIPALVTAAAYAGAASWLRTRWRNQERMYVRPLTQLVLLTLLLPPVTGTLSLLGHSLFGPGSYTWATFLEAVFRWWIGDAVSLLSLTPFLVALLAPQLPDWKDAPVFGTTRRPGVRLQGRALVILAAEIGLIVFALWLALYRSPDVPRLYFCFLPVLWMALWHGLARVTFGILCINAGVVLSVQMEPGLAPPDLQLFMIILALTGLILGALISERTRDVQRLEEARALLESRVETRTAELSRTNESLELEVRERRRAEETLQHHIQELEHSQVLLAQQATDLTLLNEKLADSERQLRTLLASKDTFFSIISHDLRSPFSVVLGISELLAQEVEHLTQEQVRTFATDIYEAARHTYDLLENLLEWAQIQAGLLSYQPITQSLHEAIAQNLELLQGNAAAKEISLQNETDPQTLVLADRHMLHSILRNLISNAIKFTPEGGRVSVASERREDHVEIAVTDTGIGMTAEDLKKLFRIDVRLRSLGTRQETGSGLGLILSKEMVEQNGGRIWAESEPGRGTTFRFTLPLGQERMDAAGPGPA